MEYRLLRDSKIKPAVTIVIPAYKEAKTIGKTLESLSTYLRKKRYPSTEVIVSVGKSEDQTLNKAMEKASLFDSFAVLHNVVHPDKGHNVQTAMLKARGDNCIYMDADLATPLHHIDKTIELLQKNDVVNAQRNISKIHKGHRKVVSVVGNFLVRLILLPGFKDTQCGFKGFRRSAAKQLFSRQKIISWGFDMEILALAKKMNYEVAHIQVPDWQDKDGGTLNEGPKKTFKAAFNTLLDLFRVRYYLSSGKYN
jgi:dolichyl-phosphate beta-glucosyltransferase